LAAQVAGCGKVGALAIGQQVKRLAEGVLDICECCLGRFKVALGLAGLGRKPVLLGSQQIDRDGLVWPPESAVGIERWILVTVGAVGVTVEAIWIAAPLVRSWWLRISPRRDRGAAARASDADGAGES